MPTCDPSLVPAQPDLSFEQNLWQAGFTIVAGIDEAGRGALAGPVVAAAVILPPDQGIMEQLSGVRDSKQMTAQQREMWREVIFRHAQAWGIGYAEPGEIDRLGIVPATQLAAQRALQSLSPSPAHLLLDYIFLPEVPLPQTALVKGDRRSLSIAAASVLAKTARDTLLRQLDATFPGYGFAAHKGYGTQAHRNALQRFGPSPIHRLSFELHKKIP